MRRDIFKNLSQPKVARLDKDQLDLFATILQERGYSRATIIQYLSHSRCFSRWMVKHGVPSHEADDQTGLEAVIPTIKRWSQASLPQHLSQEEIDTLIARSATAISSKGRRDHAILLLLCRLGLRAHEVVRLRLADINWDRASLLVRSSKTHCERTLPLTQEVGDGLLSYLRTRPMTPLREVFLKHKAPLGTLGASSVTDIVPRIIGAWFYSIVVRKAFPPDLEFSVLSDRHCRRQIVSLCSFAMAPRAATAFA